MMHIEKNNIHIILPLVLAIILPGIRMFSHAQAYDLTNREITLGWVMASIINYVLWLVLWKLWNIEYKSKRLGAFILVILFMIILPHLTTLLSTYEFPESNMRASVRYVLVMMLIVTVQFAIRSQNNITKLQLEKEQLLSENLRVQLTALQNKVDPHFLFNSMNTLLAMVKRGNENSEQFIISLSDFYRQILKNNENTTLPISEEIQVLESYLFLMKSRNTKGVKIKISVPHEMQVKHLPTLALQTTIENCFKHNSMSSKQPLIIKVQAEVDDYISVTNNVQPKFGDLGKSGVGLDLLRKRYALLGIDDAVRIDQNKESYTAQLKMLTQ